MARKRPHEKPKSLVFGPLGPRNMKEVYQYIDFSPTVSAELREAALGALLMLARLHASLADQPLLEVLAGIPTNVPLLRKYLDRMYAKRQNYSDGAWSNMRSLIFKAMRAAGVKVREGRRRVPLPPWQPLLDLLAPRQLMVLYPFCRWCVEEGLGPAETTQTVFNRYETFLDQFDGRKNRRPAFTAVVNAWEFARATVTGWPNVVISIVPRHDRFVLPWSAFGPSLYEEVKRMMHAAQHPDSAIRRRRKRINAATAKHQTEQLRRIASAIVHETGCDPKSITSIRQLVEPTAAQAALRFQTARELARQRARKQQDNSK